MEQRECAVQLINRESKHRHKKSIQMNVPTRCRLQNNVHQETLDTTCRHEKQRENVCTQRIDCNAQTEVVFLHLFLACSLVSLHKDASHKQLSTSVALPPIMVDVSLQSIARDVDSSQNSCNVKTRSSVLSAPHPVVDIVSFGNDALQSKFHPHLVTNVSLVNRTINPPSAGITRSIHVG